MAQAANYGRDEKPDAKMMLMGGKMGAEMLAAMMAEAREMPQGKRDQYKKMMLAALMQQEEYAGAGGQQRQEDAMEGASPTGYGAKMGSMRMAVNSESARPAAAPKRNGYANAMAMPMAMMKMQQQQMQMQMGGGGADSMPEQQQTTMSPGAEPAGEYGGEGGQPRQAKTMMMMPNSYAAGNEQQQMEMSPARGAQMSPQMALMKMARQNKMSQYESMRLSRPSGGMAAAAAGGAYGAGNEQQQQQMMMPAMMANGADGDEQMKMKSYGMPSTAMPMSSGPMRPAGGYGGEQQQNEQMMEGNNNNKYGQQEQQQTGAAKMPQQQQREYSNGAAEEDEQQQLDENGNAAPMGMAEPYAFDYNINDNYGGGQYRKEASDKNGVVRGSYGYMDTASGIYRHVDYVADENGFRTKIKSNEPGLGGAGTEPSAAAGTKGGAAATAQQMPMQMPMAQPMQMQTPMPMQMAAPSSSSSLGGSGGNAQQDTQLPMTPPMRASDAANTQVPQATQMQTNDENEK